MRVTSYSLLLTPEKTNVLVKEHSKNYSEEDNLANPRKIANMMRNIFDLGNKAEEYFYVIAFTAKLKPIGVFEISHGTMNNSIVDYKGIFARLLLCGDPTFVAIHNHPSGDCTPSKEDVNITKKLKEGGKLLGIQMADHVIVSDRAYFSFVEGGLL